MPGISDLLDSDMEGNNFIDENSLLSSASEEKQKAIKKPRKRKCVTMPKKPRAPTPSEGASRKETKTVTGKKRKILEDQANGLPHSHEQPDEEGSSDLEEPVPKPRKRSQVSTQSKAPKTVPTEDAVDDQDVEVQTTVAASSRHARQKSASVGPKVISKTKPQTHASQAPPVSSPAKIPGAFLIDNDAEAAEEPTQQKQQPPPAKRARTESRSRQENSHRRRAGSASDTERGDPNLRRKLGDLTRKFQHLESKYRNLKEVGVVEANANVDQLRRQCEAQAEASNKVIASLKEKLAVQAPMALESKKVQTQLQSAESEIARLQASGSELGSSLTAAQHEIKALQAKLTAARSSSAVPEGLGAKTPGSTMKSNLPARQAAVSNSEALQAAQIAQLKLDLYGDLTGLIVRSVKRAEDGDTYDCIQTGRNGTLHFKLFIDQEDAKNASFEETEFLYTPLLDVNRDKDMIELMPPYLTEDITFARQNAAKFYGRVVDTLTKRVVEEEET